MNTPSDADPAAAGYVLGHSAREMARLKAQALLIDPITKRFFESAGIGEGMRVLDVGSGAGDVAFLAARLVGAAGAVVGVDRAQGAVEEARRRAAARSLGHVSFHVGDPAEMDFDRPFDAIVGRYVLMFQSDPAAMLRKLARHARRGGVVVFHELDWGGIGSLPPVPTFDLCCHWGCEVIRRSGHETRMGPKLHAAFVRAGLPAPSMRLETLLGGGPNGLPVMQVLTGVIATLLPELERLGVATAAQVDIDTLLDRMSDEANARGSTLIGHSQIAAWSRV